MDEPGVPCRMARRREDRHVTGGRSSGSGRRFPAPIIRPEGAKISQGAHPLREVNGEERFENTNHGKTPNCNRDGFSHASFISLNVNGMVLDVPFLLLARH